MIRIVSWNVESLAPHLEAEDPALPRIAASLGDLDVLCLQEIRLRPADSLLLAQMSRALPGFSCGHALANDPINAKFRGGRTYGVATYARERFHPRHASVAWDREGRVLVTLLPEEKIAVVNVYAVNGTDKPYFDHEIGRVVGDRHRFKRRFHDDLAESCRALAKSGYGLVVIGDFNVTQAAIDTHPRLRTEEPHATNRSHFHEHFVRALDVVDAFRALWPERRAYTWFRRGARSLDAARVDYALVSRDLFPRVASADIGEGEDFRKRSDHDPISITLRERSS